MIFPKIMFHKFFTKMLPKLHLEKLDYYKIIRPLLFRMEAERAHNLSIKLLKYGLVPPLARTRTGCNLSLYVANLGFDSPVGLAAGYDKNAEIFSRMYRHGFTFSEVGTVTPRPQDGNPQPRLFRLEQDRAIINRMGFNNAGMHAARLRINYAEANLGILGVNIGKNKDSEDALEDYLTLIEYMYDVADYFTVNISSPNTVGLRDLQQRAQFETFIKAIMAERAAIAALRGFNRPIFVKLAPDMADDDLRDLLDIMLLYRVDGVILTNTTTSRPTLHSEHKNEAGGLSGAPLRDLSLHKLKIARSHVGTKLAIISAGGIMNGADAVARIRAGASLIQIYSGLIYRGFGLVGEIKCALMAELKREGMHNIEQLIGVDAA